MAKSFSFLSSSIVSLISETFGSFKTNVSLFLKLISVSDLFGIISGTPFSSFFLLLMHLKINIKPPIKINAPIIETIITQTYDFPEELLVYI